MAGHRCLNDWIASPNERKLTAKRVSDARDPESELDFGRGHPWLFRQRLLEPLQKPISDPRLLALIQRFLESGVMLEGRRRNTDEGVSQGSVLAPLLANVYLHYVPDQWFERDVLPRMRGESYIVRFADDFICAFELEADARRFQYVLPKRLAR